MAVSVTLGAGSLVALGFRLTDASTIISLGRRFGSWWTTKHGDAEFLDMLDTDQMNVMRRPNVLLDLPALDRKWSQSLRILAHRQPQTFPLDLEKGKNLPGELSKFTASMVCAVAILDVLPISPMLRIPCQSYYRDC